MSNTQFKPKKVIISGVAYHVNTLDELSKVKSSIELKKQEQQEVIERNKNKRILVKKIHASNHIRVETIVSDPPPAVSDSTLLKKSIEISQSMKHKPHFF